MTYSLGRPADGHYPEVGRTHLGSTWAGGRTYGTTLRCSCGYNAHKVSNEAPSKGGRVRAGAVYREHVTDALALYPAGSTFEVDVHGRGDFVRVTEYIFRSWTGARRLNGEPYDGPVYTLGSDQEATR